MLIMDEPIDFYFSGKITPFSLISYPVLIPLALVIVPIFNPEVIYTANYIAAVLVVLFIAIGIYYSVDFKDPHSLSFKIASVYPDMITIPPGIYWLKRIEGKISYYTNHYFCLEYVSREYHRRQKYVIISLDNISSIRVISKEEIRSEKREGMRKITNTFFFSNSDDTVLIEFHTPLTYAYHSFTDIFIFNRKRKYSRMYLSVMEPGKFVETVIRMKWKSNLS